jgi:chloride channel protein, CIC family
MKFTPGQIGKISWDRLSQGIYLGRMREHEQKVLLLLTIVIGAIVGLVVVAFILVTENLGARMYPAGGAAWRRVMVPVLGSLISGYLLFRYFPYARGSGIPQTKTALFLQGGVIRLRTVLGKFGCSSLSLASGIALGREGPSVQVGAGIASVLGRRLGLSPSATKSLIPIGSAAALAAAFNTPIAAVLFTLEEVMGDLHARVLGAIVLSSATSWMVLHLLLGDEPLFHVPAYQLVHPVEFLLYAALGAIGGLVSVIFVKLLLALRKYFLRMPPWTAWLQPVAGGLFVGVLGWFFPDVLGVGYNHVSEALNSRLALGTMALLVMLKLLATATCYASGNAGGIFGPSLFVGAMMGGAFGAGTHVFLPDYTGSVGAYALVGMAAAFAGIIRVPMTSVIMIFEVTRDYSIIVPLMIASLISYFISGRLQKKPIYEALMAQDGIHLPTSPRELEALTLVSQGLRVPVEILQKTEKIKDAVKRINGEGSAWPVLDGKVLMGMVTLAQMQNAAQKGRGEEQLGDLLPILDFGPAPTFEKFPHLHPDHPLDTAMHRMAQSGLTVLPVVSRSDLRQLVGVISLDDALSAYKTEAAPEVASGPPRGSVALLGGVLALIGLALFLAIFVGYFYRSHRIARAARASEEGAQLISEKRYQEAVEKLRTALSISHTPEDRLALATALLNSGNLNEAEIYFREYVRQFPGSGQAHLGLARIAAQNGKTQDAIGFYRQAIDGNWPDRTQNEPARIRLEFIDYLARTGHKGQIQAELLSFLTDLPADVDLRRKIARVLLRYGFSKESAQISRDILKEKPQDSAAYADLGRSQFALGEYQSAQRAFRNALARNPDDLETKKQLDLTDQLLGMDPNLSGLTAAEKYARSRELLDAVLNSLDLCVKELKPTVSDLDKEAINSAHKLLAEGRRPRSYREASMTNLAYSEQIWNLRLKMCGPSAKDSELLSALMSRLETH